MSWFNVWTGIKTKTCRYLLQRYLGQFLEERLNLEQLKVDLYNGKATVKNVSLNIDALNKLFESHGWSVEVISGHIGLLTVTVPWNALMSNSSYIEISDAVISVRPVQRQNNGTSMLESMWSSASSSMQLAEECMMQNDDENEENSEANNKSIPGLEKFAETIDNILNRIKASFTNTVLRLEYQSSDSSKTISLCFEINKLMYENETGCERHPKESYMEGRRNDNPNCRLPTSSNVDEQQGNIYLLPMFAKHNISISGLRLCTEEQKTSAGASRYISVDISKTGDIPILEINEHLNIRIKMKQSENINGPKVVINTEMGSVYTLITPRQIHLILKLMDAFQDDSCDIQAEENLEVIAFNDYKMYHKRDELVELGNWIDCEATPTNRDTLHHLRFDRIKVLPKGYSPPSSSVSSSSTVTGLSKLQRKTSSLEYSGEILNFSLKICSFVSIILIEDILVESSTNNQSPLNKTSEQNMTRFANTFFENLRRVVDKNMDSSKLTDGKNHLFIRVFPIISEGSQHRIKHMLLSKFNIIAQKLDLFEVLNGKSSELITFDRADGFNGADVSISIKSDISSKIIDIALQKCELEVDISIYDRLSAILGPSPFATFSSYNTRCYYSKQETQKLTLTTNLTSTSLEVKVRFPIFDARPIHDPNRVPWWQQNVRRDFLLISFNYVSIKIVSGVCELLSNELNVYYVEDNLEDKVWVLKTSSSSDQANALDYVKITVTIPDEHYWTKLKKSCLDKRMYGNSSRAHSDRLPFSAKRVCRESDTLHNKRDNTESETILLPGETEELKEFCSATMRTSKIQVQINVPNVEIVLGSKKFYEVIYNRFNCDLFMWEPSSPILNALHVDSTENKQSIYNISVTPAARLRNINDSYLSDFEESDSNGSHKINLKNISMAESIYFSIHDPIKSQELEHEEPDFQKSKCSVEIFIQKGSVGLFLPIRNKENLIIPEDVGKIDIKVNELKIFSVSGYNENRNLCYLCLEVGDVKMDHCGLIHEMYTKLFACGSTESDRYMRKTIYKTPEGLSKSNQPIMNERQMMSLVIETKRVTDQRIKRLRVTTSIQQATLRYNSMLSNQFWLHQLIDFLDVVDYPIEGYAPYGIITEMQLHLWNCAIDYRPSNFDYRALLELGAFTISSNVISSVNGCNLRFIIEEFILSIAPCKESTKHEKILIESRYLVPVLDIGLFDISLRLNENSSGKHPKFDLRCSVNDAHLRTCSDSGKALAQLIEHLAMDGDSLETDQNETGGTSQKSENYEIESSFLDEPNQSQQEWQQERVNLMMAEALQETVTISVSPSTSKNSGFTDHGIEPYYFPDEEQTNPSDLEYDEAEPSTDVLPQVKSDLGDVNLEPRHNVYPRRPQEDEYCVISENERQLVSQCGVRDVKVCEDPLRIVDNHFCLPSNKIDLLKSPYDFPIPVSRYTLCEMTFTWHLYGGNDFISIPENMSATSEASHLRMSDAYKHGVSYSKADSVHGANKPKDLSWKTIGGVQRNHGVIVEIQLTKVRLSYEIYPNYTAQASRQVLVINDIEIRDRLQSSEINKFLYHPSTRTTSHKSPQQMVVIKALHVRPNPKLSAAEECSLRISLLPMRLHIDQDTLIFLADYFTNMGNNMKEAHATDNPPPEAHAPVMDVGPSELENELQARKLISTNLELLENEVMNKSLAQMEAKEKHSPIYFREVLFSPDVPIRFDYHGHRVELSRGPIAGLLMGLGQLQCSEIRLKKIIHRRGFLGIEKLVTYLCKEWLKDIKRNQLPKILKGVGPTYSFVQFIQGVIDLFRLPIEQYQRDGRIIRGLQLGAQSFTARTALAALEITSRIIQLLQFTAETAFDMVSSGPSVGRVRKHRKDKKKRAQRPKDVREGVTNAYLIVKEGINDSAANLIETAVAEHDQKGYTGAVGAVMRQIPQLVVCPAVLATQATTNILGGVKSSLVPEAKVEAREKWKTDND
ncbi:PREDICTED: autophagy-related protein 2 homolog B [Rhagoletis zephyria]|uniref:autophagy-related protein 2 homolog B n=1 Tax=Rhagoletis zephyria TaxID=28612 RepID=UPI0008118E62|nr:PREDICTED: autophagy-related protein 2 homolog B [Rhagoletis zephyria]